MRHGESEWNAERIIQGQNDTSRLTPLGRVQARDVAMVLSALTFDRLVASDLRRAHETALIIASTLGLVPELEALLRVVLDGDARPPGGESLRDGGGRAGNFVTRANRQWPGERLLVVSHGGMLNALRLFHSGAPLEGQSWYRVGNCEVWDLDGPVDLSPDGDEG